MSEGTFESVHNKLLSSLDILELEAARLVVLAKANNDDPVLGTSASLIYKTIAVVREDLQKLHKLNAPAGE